jgi:anaerobic magnesium-protoporphyrin IX monomethyl ester cyclase
MVGVESGDQTMLDWMKKDATLEHVIATAERCARHGVGAIFNFIVGFPGEPPHAFEATLALVKRLRRLSPRFETPIFYYRPYPGTPIAEAARRTGYRFPGSLEGWADFDYVGARGPWITPEQYQRVEGLKFYARHAYGPGGPLRWPLRAVSRWRCARDFYGFPVEKRLAEWVRPPVSVS